MRIVVVGAGMVGQTVVAQLSKEGHDIVVVDQNVKRLLEFNHRFDIMTVCGHGASLGILSEAGAGYSDLVIALTESDEVNLLACVIAKKLGAAHTIARVRSPEHTSEDELVLLRSELGISLTVNPEQSAAREVMRLLQFPALIKRETLGQGKVDIAEIKLGTGSPLCGVALKSLHSAIKQQVLVCVVQRGEDVFIPGGNFVLGAGDSIYVAAGVRSLGALLRDLGMQSAAVDDVIIVGGSRVAFYLAKALVQAGVRTRLIESDPARCAYFAGQLPELMVIEGDGSLPELLLEEGLAETDALVALTNMDEQNIIVSLQAQRAGVPKVITKTNREEYFEVCKNIGLGSIINPKHHCADIIVRYVRARGNTAGGSVLSLRRIAGGRAEALEFVADVGTRHLGEPLRGLQLRKNLLVACIIRGGRSIVPKGDDCLHEGDTVIVVSTGDMAISELNDIFSA